MTPDRLILKCILIKQWKMACVLIMGVTISMLLLTPNVYARNLSDSQRYNDGYNNGYSAALSDSSYNPTCDPNQQYTSGGGHTATYCNGWANGYNDAWNRSNNNNQGGNQQQQTSNVNIHGNNNKVQVNQGQSSNSGNTFSPDNTYGNNPNGGSNPTCRIICIS